MTLLQRIFAEKRVVIILLGLGIAVNIGVYALVARPLEVKAAGTSDRADAASAALRGAQRDLASARALVAGKTRAEEELTTFYSKVIPEDLSAARRMTYATLPALARKTGVKYEQRRVEIDQTPAVKSHRLGHLKIRMVLQGDYASIRRFIYELETAPLFVIIDAVNLAQPDPTRAPTLAMELSTYYQLGADGN